MRSRIFWPAVAVTTESSRCDDSLALVTPEPVFSAPAGMSAVLTVSG